jgi:hypothetical protein
LRWRSGPGRARPGSRERFQERYRECSNFSVLSDSFPIK